MRAKIIGAAKNDKAYAKFWKTWSRKNQGRIVGLEMGSFVERDVDNIGRLDMVVVRGKIVADALIKRGLKGYILEYPVYGLKLDKTAQAEYAIWKLK